MHLSTLLVAAPLALTAFAAPLDEDKIDDRPLQPLVQPRVPVDQTLWDTMQFYGPFSTNAIQGDCAPPPHGAERVTYINDEGSDTQAAIFRLHGERPSEGNIIVSFPGTSGAIDTIRNLVFVPVPWVAPGIDCPGCLVHAGFLDAWNAVQETVISTIEAELLANPGYTVVVTGHSLGGALGTLAYSSLRSLNHPTVGWITASPRVGNQLAADHIDFLSGSTDENIGSFYRVTASNDLVPQLPPLKPLFVHPRTEIWLSGPTDPEQNVGNTFRCFGQEAPDCNAGAFPHSYDTHSEYSGTDDDFICNENGDLVPWE